MQRLSESSQPKISAGCHIKKGNLWNAKNCGNIESDDSVFCKKCNSLIFNADLYFEKYIKTNEGSGSQNIEIDSGEPRERMKPSKYSWAETPAERELRLSKGTPVNKNKPDTSTPDAPYKNTNQKYTKINQETPHAEREPTLQRGASSSNKTPTTATTNTPQKNTNQKNTKANQAENPQSPKKEIIPLQTGKAEFKFDSASARVIEINGRARSTHISTKKEPTEIPRKAVDSPPRNNPSNPKQSDSSDSSGTPEEISPVVAAIFRACKYLFVLVIIVGLLKSCGRGGSGSSGVGQECEGGIGGALICRPIY